MLARKEQKVKPRRLPPLSAFSKAILSLVIADVVLLLVLTYGSVFPSRIKITIPDPEQQQPDSYYDSSAKVSPFPKAAPKRHRGSPYPALLVPSAQDR